MRKYDFLTKFGTIFNVLKKIQCSPLDPSVCVCVCVVLFACMCVCVHGCVGWGAITASCWLRRSPVCSVGHLWVA